MASLPSWLIPLIKMAISIGSPYLLKLIQGWIKNLPPEVLDIINELIKALTDPTVSNKEAKRAAKAKLKACTGVGCAPETKRD